MTEEEGFKSCSPLSIENIETTIVPLYETVFLEFIVKRARFNSQGFGRFGLIPFSLPHRPFEKLPLNGFERTI